MKKSKHITLLDSKHFECSIIYDPTYINMGIRIGIGPTYSFLKDVYLFINTEFIFWSFGIEIRRKKYDNT